MGNNYFSSGTQPFVMREKKTKDKKKYDFNVCIKCNSRNKDIPCDEDCIYLDELLEQGDKEK